MLMESIALQHSSWPRSSRSSSSRSSTVWSLAPSSTGWLAWCPRQLPSSCILLWAWSLVPSVWFWVSVLALCFHLLIWLLQLLCMRNPNYFFIFCFFNYFLFDSPTLMPLILFSGFLIPFPSIQDQWWIVWLYYISFFQYAFKIMAISQFAHLNFTSCGPTGNQTEEWIIGCIENFANCTPPLKEKAACPWGFGTQPGEAVLHSFGIRPDQLTVSFLILCALFVAVVLLSLSITVFRLKRR